VLIVVLVDTEAAALVAAADRARESSADFFCSPCRSGGRNRSRGACRRSPGCPADPTYESGPRSWPPTASIRLYSAPRSTQLSSAGWCWAAARAPRSAARAATGTHSLYEQHDYQ
jgi:hypothetical protein